MHIEHDIFYICFVFLLPGRHIWSKQMMHCQQMCWAASADNRTREHYCGNIGEKGNPMQSSEGLFKQYSKSRVGTSGKGKLICREAREREIEAPMQCWLNLRLCLTSSIRRQPCQFIWTIESFGLTITLLLFTIEKSSKNETVLSLQKIISTLQTLHDRPCFYTIQTVHKKQLTTNSKQLTVNS